ncbi:helix-turn-helix transcriptional regulator [Treponema parvum]|uniref:Helix-turn-helix transcriptional regulator n=1 Tax=Treponema parvum TaxID=138851 RepID=A0A975F094_9SPIR|nr:helix-turn-helix transcriptional regulator [Treponema parvum]QTQ12206.1 helix-turn-helix transcriptional regulator [Treponema parvum]QTQ15811.1 helix-turn-helix transcriptional regulator [Treponema parvum]
MTTLTNIQFIKNQEGMPEYAIVPFNVFQTLISGSEQAITEEKTIPHEIIKNIAHQGISPVQAWREYLGLTQTYVAEKIGISQAAYCQMEKAKKIRKATKIKIAQALNIDYSQIDIF